MKNTFAYNVLPMEFGAQVELYLPKKSVYQGMLYDTLTKGFDMEHVHKHFSNPLNRSRIEKMLNPDSTKMQ